MPKGIGYGGNRKSKMMKKGMMNGMRMMRKKMMNKGAMSCAQMKKMVMGGK